MIIREDMSETEERPGFHELLAESNLQRMWWLLIGSTSLSVAYALYNLLVAHKISFAPWQIFDIGGSLIFLALMYLARRGRLSQPLTWWLGPAYFAFWLVLMDGYYFTGLAIFGESATYALGVVTPAILIVLPPRWFLSLLVPNHLVFCLLLMTVERQVHGYTMGAIMGSLANGSLGVIVAIIASWYRYTGARRLWQREQLLAARTREAKLAESHLLAILENIPFQAWLKDLNGVFLSVNREFAEAYGKPESEIVGKSTWELYPPERAQKYLREAEQIARLQQRKFFEDFVIEAGRKRWFEVFISPVIGESGVCIGTAGLARDITDRHEMQQRLVAADNAKSDFLATMSHEIRTPMNSVLGYAHLLKQMPLTDLQREYVDSINHSGKLLLTIINDILDFSKIEAGKITLQLEEVPLRSLFQRILNMFEPLAREKNLALRLRLADSVPAVVRLDPHRVEQMLINLLSNALKFTDHGSVELRVFAEAADRNWRLIMEVADTGIGIAPGQMERLFKPFSQLSNNVTRQLSGTGLGLIITERLGKLMGGSIQVHSEVQVGSTFVVTIQAEAVDSVRAESPSALGTGSTPLDFSGYRVLVVEDNPVNRRLAAAILERWNLDVRLAGEGAEALKQISSGHFDVVLMDVQMPGMDGLEATRRIRQWETLHPERGRVQIIAVTAFAGTEDQARCRAAGMDGYLAKPLNVEALGKILAKLFGPKL